VPYGTNRTGLFTIKTVSFVINKSFYPDFMYKCKYINGARMARECVNGYLYGDILFSNDDDHEQYDKFRRLVHGPSSYHSGQIYASSDRNQTYALRRLTSMRLRDDQFDGGEYHHQLYSNQQTACTAYSRLFGRFRDELEHAYNQLPQECEALFDLIQQPHPKKRLRMRAFYEIMNNGFYLKEVWKHEVKGKIKRCEYAKAGKLPRLINDLTTEVSLMGAVLSKTFKDVLDRHTFTYHDSTAEFVKSPDHQRLSDVFHKLNNSVAPVYMVYHSDDSCVTLKHDDGTMHTYNLDISSADGSVGPHLFTLFISLLPRRLQHLGNRLVKQLKQQLVLRSHNNRGRVKINFEHEKLYSGSVLTTIMNCLGNLLIFCSLVDNPGDPVRAAELAGYKITMQPCLTHHKIQFLKHSPVLVNGCFKPLQNVGVILRAYGSTKTQLPGNRKMTLKQRATLFNSMLANGFYSHNRHSLTRILHSKRVDDQSISQEYFSTSGDGVTFCDDSEIYRRYDLTADQYNELLSLYLNSDVGDVLRCYASDRILFEDYGL